jgi:hypothetical protein
MEKLGNIDFKELAIKASIGIIKTATVIALGYVGGQLAAKRAAKQLADPSQTQIKV